MTAGLKPASFFVLLLFFGFQVRGQYSLRNFNNANDLMTDGTGKPLYLQINYNIIGSPFYPGEYYKASICAESGKIYRDVPAKFNMMDHLLLIKKADDSEVVVVTPVSRIVFTDEGDDGMMADRVFEKGFPKTGLQSVKTWYEVLDSGKVKLLKLRVANYMDKKSYGSSSITREFSIEESLFLYSPSAGMNKLSKGIDAILPFLNGKINEIASYISEKGLKCKKEIEIIQLIHYFNSLPN